MVVGVLLDMYLKHGSASNIGLKTTGAWSYEFQVILVPV